MSDPPDDVFSSDPINISDGINISSTADWVSLGFDTRLIEQGRLTFSLDNFDMSVDLGQLVFLLSVDLPVVVSLENGLDEQLEVEATSVELLSQNGTVVSSGAIDPLTLSAGEQRNETVSLNAGDVGNLTIQASNGDVSADQSIEVVEGDFSLDVSLPETIKPDENLNVTVTVQNNSSLETNSATLVTGHNTGTNPEGGLMETVPSLGSGEVFEYSRIVGSQYLNEGENTVSAFLWSGHIQEGLVVVEPFNVSQPKGVDLIANLNVADIDLDGYPLWYTSFLFDGDFGIRNDGGKDASNVTVRLVCRKDGNKITMSGNTWSYATIGAGGEVSEWLSGVGVDFVEMGEHTFELTVDADELDAPIVIKDTMVVADDPGEARLNVDLLSVEDTFGMDQQFDVSIEEDSGTPAEELEVEAAVQDEWGSNVFEEVRNDLPEIAAETETLSFDAGVLPAGDYQIEVTANALNTTGEVTATRSLQIVDPDSLPLGVTVSAADISFGGESDVTADITSKVGDRNLTSVVVDVVYYNQLDNQVSEPNRYNIGTISPGESVTVKDTHPITECWRSEMECIPGADNGSGEYTVKIIANLDQADDPISGEDTFQAE